MELPTPPPTPSPTAAPIIVSQPIVPPNETMSLLSIAFAYDTEDGRKYTARVKDYPIPNDEAEQGRELLMHEMLRKLTDGKLFFAPINPQKILDVGTGTGAWAVAVGDKYPSAKVLGIDVTPIQPNLVPENVQFIVDDCEKDWLDENLDLVHFRFMTPILTNVPFVIEQAYKSLRPGGWVEFQEVIGSPQCDDGTMHRNDGFETVCQLAAEAYSKLGFNTTSAEELEGLLRVKGFQNMKKVELKAPIGDWEADESLRFVGSWQKVAILDFVKTLAARPFRALGLPDMEANLRLCLARRALKDQTVHRYLKYCFWYAQKPQMSASASADADSHGTSLADRAQ